jgi:7-cyano-7-deazaguanine synthase in queuosine biosynthesis
MSKNILQLFTGGLDSTALLIKNLEEGNNVFPLYIRSCMINEDKREIEEKVAENIIEMLKKKGFDNVYNLLKTDIDFLDIRGLSSAQPIVMILGIFYTVQNGVYFATNEVVSIDGARNNSYNFPVSYNGWVKNKQQKTHIKFDEVQISYVAHDEALSFLDEIKNLYNSLLAFKLEFSYAPEIPPLTFPLIKHVKHELFFRYNRNYNDIINQTWSCEEPKIKLEKREGDDKESIFDEVIYPCGECGSCERIKFEIGEFFFENLVQYKRKGFNKETLTTKELIVSPKEKEVKDDDKKETGYVSLKRETKHKFSDIKFEKEHSHSVNFNGHLYTLDSLKPKDPKVKVTEH